MTTSPTFRFTLVNPEEALFEGEIISLTVPGTEGYLQVLANHAPLLAALKNGTVTVIDSNNIENAWDIKGGFLEVSHNNATLIAS